METELNVVKRCVAFLLKQFDYKKMELNEKTLKELTATIRKVVAIIPAFIDVLFGHLRRDDCDLRIGILIIANHFFQRSHNFRLELINSMQDFLVYTLETDPLHYPLPTPSEAAELLKKQTLTTLRLWIEKFGDGYAKLQRMENFLRNSKSLDWENSEVNLQIDREREERDRFQRELRARKVVEKVEKLFNESRTEIERIQVEAHSVVELVFPRFCPLDGAEEKRNGECTNRLFNFGESSGITICLNGNGIGIESSAENIDLINQLKDTAKQLERWHSKLGNWLRKLAAIGDSSALTKRLIDARRCLGEELEKCGELKVVMGQNGENNTNESSESDNDEFVDVEEKEGYEPEFCGIVDQPTTSSSSTIPLSNDRAGPSRVKLTNSNEKKMDAAKMEDGKCPPKLAMGLDLKYWGEEGVRPAQRVQNQAEEHWWRQMENSDPPTEAMEAYNSRQITFIGERPQIQRVCRAPLPSGKLCPRMQLYRCALHGPIVERDEQGFPVEEQKSNEMKTALDERQKREEEEFLRDVEAATGAKLSGPEKRVTNGRTARARERSENLKTRERLKTKLFDKRTIKRVTTTLEQMQKARAERNFSHQFNYALSNKR